MKGAASSGFACLLLFLVACAADPRPPVDLQQIGNWGLGWSLKGAPNRLNKAIPPMLHMLREDRPELRAVAPPPVLRTRYRAALNGLDGLQRRRVENRLIGAYTVDGLGCAGRSFSVFDEGQPVAVFLVIDATRIVTAEARWCDEAAGPPSDLKRFIPGKIIRLLVASGKAA